MLLHKNNDVPPSPLAARLRLCVERVGNKRAMATAALVSEAQLFRYLNAETDMPTDKLLAIARAARVDAGWLLTGNGDMESGVVADKRPAFRGELLTQITQLLEELLVEFEKPFNPRQRARAITFLYNALRHEETTRGIEYTPTKFDMLKYINFLAELRTEEELEILTNALNLIEYGHRDPQQLTKDQLDLLRTFINLIVRGMKGFYSSYPGQVYFERTSGGQLDSNVVLSLQNLVVNACQVFQRNDIDWLDIGCGNGRHLAHIAKHMPNVRIKGIEPSLLGLSYCKDLMNAEKLPQDCVINGDARKLPFSNQSFDVVYANLSLYGLPYLPETGLGLEEAIGEISRVLRPRGTVNMIFPEGNWLHYSYPAQCLTQPLVDTLAHKFGFDVVLVELEIDQQPEKNKDSTTMPSSVRINHYRFLNITLKKRA